MRSLAVCLSALALVMLLAPLPAGAAGRKCYHVCWEATTGRVECQCLPDNYSLPGLERPVCMRRNCSSPQVDFILTRQMIHALSRYVSDTSTMAPLHHAYVHAPYRRLLGP